MVQEKLYLDVVIHLKLQNTTYIILSIMRKTWNKNQSSRLIGQVEK